MTQLVAIVLSGMVVFTSGTGFIDKVPDHQRRAYVEALDPPAPEYDGDDPGPRSAGPRLAPGEPATCDLSSVEAPVSLLGVLCDAPKTGPPAA
jgi:hypothetical protein